MKRLIRITIIIVLIFTIFGNFCKVNAAPKQGTDGTGGNGGNGTIDVKTKDTRASTEQSRPNWTDIFSLGEKFISEGKANPTFKDTYTSNEENFSEDYVQKEFSGIFYILLAIGTVLTVIVGGILGIKFIFSSIEDKAKIKEALIPYILGCVVIYGAIGIWYLVVNLLNQI